MRHPCRRVIPDSLLGSPTTSTQKLRPTGFGCATGQAMWTRPAQKISSCRSCKPYRSCRGAGPTRSLPPSLPDGDQRGCPFGPLRRDLLRRNSNFLGFMPHLLVSGDGPICDFVLSPANVRERRAQVHLLAVEAKRQALRSAFLAKARPVLAVGGLLQRLAREPFRQKRQSALACAAARQESQVGRRDGASGLLPWPSGSDRERLLVALRVVSD